MTETKKRKSESDLDKKSNIKSSVIELLKSHSDIIENEYYKLYKSDSKAYLKRIIKEDDITQDKVLFAIEAIDLSKAIKYFNKKHRLSSIKWVYTIEKVHEDDASDEETERKLYFFDFFEKSKEEVKEEMISKKYNEKEFVIKDHPESPQDFIEYLANKLERNSNQEDEDFDKQLEDLLEYPKKLSNDEFELISMIKDARLERENIYCITFIRDKNAYLKRLIEEDELTLEKIRFLRYYNLNDLQECIEYEPKLKNLKFVFITIDGEKKCVGVYKSGDKEDLSSLKLSLKQEYGDDITLQQGGVLQLRDYKDFIGAFSLNEDEQGAMAFYPISEHTCIESKDKDEEEDEEEDGDFDDEEEEDEEEEEEDEIEDSDNE